MIRRTQLEPRTKTQIVARPQLEPRAKIKTLGQRTKNLEQKPESTVQSQEQSSGTKNKEQEPKHRTEPEHN